jgi:hypothetical protein
MVVQCANGVVEKMRSYMQRHRTKEVWQESYALIVQSRLNLELLNHGVYAIPLFGELMDLCFGIMTELSVPVPLRKRTPS